MKNSTRSLHELQQQFQTNVLNAASNASKKTSDRLSIYSEGYVLRLHGVIADDFPTLRGWMGETDFDGMAAAYLKQYVSSHYNIRYISQWLADFLASAKPYCEQIELQEFAQFEWTLEEAREARDADCYTLEELQQVLPDDWPALRLAGHPSVHCLHLHANIPELWQAYEDKASWPKLQINEQAIAWLIWRHESAVHYCSLDEVEYWTWLQLSRGENFATICEGLCSWETEDQVAQRLLNILLPWINNGLIAVPLTYAR